MILFPVKWSNQSPVNNISWRADNTRTVRILSCYDSHKCYYSTRCVGGSDIHVGLEYRIPLRKFYCQTEKSTTIYLK